MLKSSQYTWVCRETVASSPFLPQNASTGSGDKKAARLIKTHAVTIVVLFPSGRHPQLQFRMAFEHAIFAKLKDAGGHYQKRLER